MSYEFRPMRPKFITHLLLACPATFNAQILIQNPIAVASNNFIDYVKLVCRSGKGGAGSHHFFRAKGLPNGGPDGGDGGRGGHIILEGNSQLWTLLHLQYQKHVFAKDGDGGGPGKPDVQRPDTSDLLKRMKRVDPDAARRYRQRSGE